jgi:hypothetical protein
MLVISWLFSACACFAFVCEFALTRSMGSYGLDALDTGIAAGASSACSRHAADTHVACIMWCGWLGAACGVRESVRRALCGSGDPW